MSADLPYPYGAASIDAVIKQHAADFEVEEVLGFEPGGDGEHLFLWVEKQGLTTPELVTRIARDFALSESAVSHSGLKDKHAVTRQWLSLHLPGKDSPEPAIEGSDYRVLSQRRHHRKLRPGTHKANRFRLRLRGISELSEATRQQIDLVASQGFANYFGHQRFGSRQDNLQQALRQLTTRKLSRSRRGLLISSLRSHLFNTILARRLELGHWAEPLEGDVFMLHGSHSIFSEPVNAELLRRYRELDISSCASLYGSGSVLMSATALAIERAVFDENRLITDCLQQQGSRLQMRPLRAVADSFDYAYDAAAEVLDIEMCLPTGSYATSLLNHFAVVRDASSS